MREREVSYDRFETTNISDFSEISFSLTDVKEKLVV